jgi:hypothetical protein
MSYILQFQPQNPNLLLCLQFSIQSRGPRHSYHLLHQQGSFKISNTCSTYSLIIFSRRRGNTGKNHRTSPRKVYQEMIQHWKFLWKLGSSFFGLFVVFGVSNWSWHVCVGESHPLRILSASSPHPLRGSTMPVALFVTIRSEFIRARESEYV